MEEAVRLAEDFMMVEQGAEPVKKDRSGSSVSNGRQDTMSRGHKAGSLKTASHEIRNWESKEILCFRCGEKGHIARFLSPKGSKGPNAGFST